jgi:flagellar biosynthesis protein FliQ
MINWSREALRMALVLAGPPLAAAVIVALLIGLIQTLTQMHEPVVAQVPRQLAVLVVVLALLPWMLTTWVAYTRGLIGSLGG